MELSKCLKCKNFANPNSYQCPLCGVIFRSYRIRFRSYRIRQVIMWLAGLATAAWAVREFVPKHI